MRLLNTTSLGFEEFFDRNEPPPYAILSHRWSDMEVLYHDYDQQTDWSGSAKGYRKIYQCCELARQRNRKYIWIDSLCIDKRNTHEVTESVNSMWRYYTNAIECYAYLVDVPPFAAEKRERLRNWNGRPSEWFRRGWTLQELLAPQAVLFCDWDWKIIGQKSDASMLDEISKITSIPGYCLLDRFRLFRTCVAQKLSWASTRKTTKQEDRVYSLLGLLGINMPLFYGEGEEKAFLRLQQEVIRQTDDESIFAWRRSCGPDSTATGILASTIDAFSHSGDVYVKDEIRSPYMITNKGLQIHTEASRVEGQGPKDRDVYIIPINCQYGGPRVNGSTRPYHSCSIAIVQGKHSYSRIASASLGAKLDVLYPAESRIPVVEPQTFYIRLAAPKWADIYPEYRSATRVLTTYLRRRKIQRARELQAMDHMSSSIRTVEEPLHYAGLSDPQDPGLIEVGSVSVLPEQRPSSALITKAWHHGRRAATK